MNDISESLFEVHIACIEEATRVIGGGRTASNWWWLMTGMSDGFSAAASANDAPIAELHAGTGVGRSARALDRP